MNGKIKLFKKNNSNKFEIFDNIFQICDLKSLFDFLNLHDLNHKMTLI